MINFKNHIIAICLITAGLVIPTERSFGQKESDFNKQNIIEQRIEIIAASVDETVEIDYTNLFEDLSFYFEQPINLNSANSEDLRELYLLNELQINALQNHIARFGNLKSIYELQSIKFFDLNTIRLIQPFVTVAPQGMLSDFTWRNMFKEGTGDLFLRYRRTLQEQAGFIPDPAEGEPANYVGSPDYMFTRFRFQYRKNLIAGFTLEKDAGESLQNGPDFASGHVFIRNNNAIKALALGDFQAQFGQGLTFWNGLGFGKSPFVMNVKKNANGLRPYTSVNESLFLRGAGTTLAWRKWELTALYSRKNIDGNVQEQSDSTIVDDGVVVSSLLIAGLHRTESELANKGTVQEDVAVGNLKYATRTFSASMTAAHIEYSAEVIPRAQLYQIYRFSGRENTNIGIDYQKVYRNFNVFGEFSRSANGGMAALNGFIAALHPRISVSGVHRWFEKDYQVQYFNVFAENFTPQNERGMYLGVEANLAKGWTLAAYSDQIRYEWLRYQLSTPTTASDHLVQLNYKPDKKQDFYFRYQVRNRGEDLGAEDARIDYPVAERIQNFRLNAIYQPHPNVQMRSRLEWKIYEKALSPTVTGFLIYQDVIWKKTGSKISFNTRYAIFNTPTFDAAIWAYESDVLYAFTIPSHNGRGQRMYALMKWDIRRGLDMWVRYAQWIYFDRQTISSGNNEISGNRRGDVTVQVRWQF